MTDNLKFYEMGRKVPQEAQRPISAGRLKGMTDINPMWRIKKLTEMFGPCGIGWYTEIVDIWRTESTAGTETGCEMIVECKINLYIKVDGEWSKPIVGIGGATTVANERNGYYTDDESSKKAYTDAISVACKALGIGADIYYAKDTTKYTPRENAPKTAQDARKDSGAPVTPPTAVSTQDNPWLAQMEQMIAGSTVLTMQMLNGIALRDYNTPLDQLNELQQMELEMKTKGYLERSKAQ